MLKNNTTKILKEGLDKSEIFNQLNDFKSHDVPWQSGRAFAYVYEAPPATKAIVGEAIQLYLSENALDPTAFPSLLKLEQDVISIVINLLHGNAATVGNFTSGGTESIILALKTARDYFRVHKPQITQPEIIVCETAHAAFHKACHYLGLTLRLVPMDAITYTIDLQAVKDTINENTILLVGSAPNYSHGVMDPIVDLAALAKEKGIFCHVDACVGGFYLPFAKMIGEDIPAFDFAVEGVTSISCDLHKYGYTVKGASVILYSNATIRKYQIFTCSDWTGYSIINPTVLSSKSGATLAGAWAAIHHLGEAGYKKMAQQTQAATQQFIKGISAIDGLKVLGKPVMNLVAVQSTKENVNIFQIADKLKEKAWHIQVQLASERSPEALHLNINYANVEWIDELLADLAAVVASLSNEDNTLPEIPLDFFMEMLEEIGGFDNLANALGLGQDNTIDDFAMVNNVLNQLPSHMRTMLLTEFTNRMFVAR